MCNDGYDLELRASCSLADSVSLSSSVFQVGPNRGWLLLMYEGNAQKTLQFLAGVVSVRGAICDTVFSTMSYQECSVLVAYALGCTI